MTRWAIKKSFGVLAILGLLCSCITPSVDHASKREGSHSDLEGSEKKGEEGKRGVLVVQEKSLAEFRPKSLPNPVIPELSYRRLLGENYSGRSFDHQDWDALLKVCRNADGSLEMLPLARNAKRLKAYLRRVKSVDFTRLQRHEQAALLLNTWNARVCELLLGAYVAGEEVEDVLLCLSDKMVEVGGNTCTMFELEHHILRADYADPRLVFVLFRGTRGGPGLPSEAFSGQHLLAQLTEGAAEVMLRAWEAHPGKLSEYVRWYWADFGGEENAERFLDSLMLNQKGQQVPGGRVVLWLDYDWTAFYETDRSEKGKTVNEGR